MKLLCDRHQLQEAFGIVAGVVPQKTPKAILQNVLLRADKDSVTFFATDGEMAARVSVDSVKVTKPGKVLLPAREAGALLRELSDPTITLESKEFRCHIESGGGSFILLGEDPELYPLEKAHEGQSKLVVEAGKLLDMLKRTTFAVARDESRYAVQGELFEVKDSSLRLVATDGRRLSLCYLNLDGDEKPVRAIVPVRILQALMRAIPEGSKEPLTLQFSGTQIAFQIGKTLLVSRLLDATFPEYENVIPKSADTTVELNKAALESNLRKVAVLSDGDTRMVRFQFSSSSLQLSAEASTKGRGDIVMDVDVKGPGVTLGFDPDFLLEGLRTSDLEVVTMSVGDDTTPAKLTLGESHTYIVMPISGS